MPENKPLSISVGRILSRGTGRKLDWVLVTRPRAAATRLAFKHV